MVQSSESSLPMLCSRRPGLCRKSSPVLDQYPYKLDQQKIQFSHPSRTQQEFTIATQVDRTRRRDKGNVVESSGWDKSCSPSNVSHAGSIWLRKLLSTATQLVELKKEMLPCGDCLSFMFAPPFARKCCLCRFVARRHPCLA